jgi:diguanylate cyclase (GGDEF)-like protein
MTDTDTIPATVSEEVGRILKEQMRDSDVLVRYAGDEFIAVLPKTSYEQARQFPTASRTRWRRRC